MEIDAGNYPCGSAWESRLDFKILNIPHNIELAESKHQLVTAFKKECRHIMRAAIEAVTRISQLIDWLLLGSPSMNRTLPRVP